MHSELATWYREWLDINKLPQLSADELLATNFFGNQKILSNDQEEVVRSFSLVWDQIQQIDPNLSISENYKVWLKNEKISDIIVSDHLFLSDNQKKLISAFEKIIELVEVKK